MDQRVAIIKEIRAKLGCGLREAADLYESHGGAWRERVNQILESGVQYQSPLEKARDAIRAYYAALDSGVSNDEAAMRKAFSAIQVALGMFWTPKGDIAYVCRHCNAAIRQVPSSEQWLSVAYTVLPQYCWVDPAHGSKLHEPQLHKTK